MNTMVQQETKSLVSQPLSNIVAQSTPVVIDHMEVVRTVAKRKTLNGSVSFTSKKGKQSLFSGVCAVIKSSLGLGASDRLPDEEVDKINQVIGEFWQKQATSLLTFGEVTGARFDVPVVKFNKDGVSDAHFTASIQARRNAKDQPEKNFAVASTLAGLKRRLEMMDKSPSKYTGEQKREAQSKIRDCENYIAANQPKVK